jgi:hypothetical protein
MDSIAHHLQAASNKLSPSSDTLHVFAAQGMLVYVSGASLCVLPNEITAHERAHLLISIKWSNRLIVCRSRRRRCNYYHIIWCTHASIKQDLASLGRVPQSALSFAQREHIIYVNDLDCCNALALNKQEISLNKRTIEAALSEFMIFVKSISSPNCN